MIGLDGQVHYYPKWFFLLLKANRNLFLERDRATGYWRILDSILVLRELLETRYFNPSRQLKASSLGPKVGWRSITLFDMLGGMTTPGPCSVDPVQTGPETGEAVTVVVEQVRSRRLQA